MALAAHKRIVATKGPAAGRINGFSHIAIIVRDMDESVSFYRDLLGLKVVKTNGRFNPKRLAKAMESAGGAVVENVYTRQYFFELGNSELLTMYEVSHAARTTDAALVYPLLWPSDGPAAPNAKPQKMDHLAFNVESRDDLVWFQAHLRAAGVTVSEIEERVRDTAQGFPKFVKSIYFYDPSGITLEIATLDLHDPDWENYDFSEWLTDPAPVPSLLE
jgi:catechol 2,3-dioxygenase-like lactoylglutathione lyase family enzyme